MQITGSTFLITGGVSGLGAATARQLVAAGANVVIADVKDEPGGALATELGQARFVKTDVTDEASVKNAIDVAVREFGNLRGAVNCAGIAIAMKVLAKEG